MGSCSMRKGKAPAFQVEAPSPSFIKMIMGKDLRDGKLEIPEAFVVKYGNCLPQSVFLAVPNGTVWPIKLESCDGKLWFQKGWPEFAKLYCLDHGYLLAFIYEGECSCFQVRIYKNLGSLEIDYYPFSSSHHEEQKPCGGGDRGMSTVWRTQPSPAVHGRYGKQQLEDLKDRAFSRANNFTSGNPFVVIKMNQTHISNRLKIPISFAKKYICQEGICDVTLQISDEKGWTVGCSISSCARLNASTWRIFVLDNDLKEGDTCVFEHIGNRKFQVWIFRASEESVASPLRIYIG